MRNRPKDLLAGMVIYFALPTSAFCEGHPYAAPQPSELAAYIGSQKVLVIERYDAAGDLVARSIEDVQADIVVETAIDRRIGRHRIRLRGLLDCPAAAVTYNRRQNWSCKDAAADYAGAIYNGRASVILCKTYELKPSTQGGAVPASCFALVGGGSEPYRTVSDDDSMVFLGLASVALTKDGQPRRPDLMDTQNLSRNLGVGDAR